MEDAEVRVPRRGVPGGIVVGVGADLHHHHILVLLVALHHELQVVAEVEGRGGQREHGGIGRDLEERPVVEVHGAQLEVLAEVRGEHVHHGPLLPDNAGCVVVEAVAQQGIAHVGVQPPARDVQLALDAGRGDLAELVVPGEMVEVEMLLVVGGLAQGSLEMRRQADRALACPAEREEAELRIGFHVEVGEIVAEQHVAGLGVPESVVPQLSLGPGVEIHGVLHVLGRADAGAVEILLEVVAHAQVELGDDARVGPGLEADIDLVVEPGDAHRVGAGVAVAVEVVIAQPGFAGDVVVVLPGVGGELAAVADEGRGEVTVQAVGVEVEGAVALGTHPADEGEGDAQLLVHEEGVLLDLGAGAGQVHGDVAGVHRGVPDPGQVGDAAVLLPVHDVADVARVQGVALAQVVGLDDGGLVGGLLALEHATAAEAVVQQGDVECRSDVLGGEDVEVVGLLVAVGEQGARVAQFGVGDLGVVVRQGAVRVAPGLLGVIEFHALVAVAQEPVVVLHRRAGYAQPGCVDVAPAEGIVVEVVIEGGVGDGCRDFAEVGVLLPSDDALVVERVGQDVGLQDARGGLRDGVADVLLLLLDPFERIHLGEFALGALLPVVGPALLGRQAGIPGFEAGLGLGEGVEQEQGVQLAPKRGVQLGLERVARAQGQHRVGAHRGGVRPFADGGGVEHGDLLQGEGAAQFVAGHGIDHGVRRRDPHALGRAQRLYRAAPVIQRPGGGDRHHRGRKGYAREQTHTIYKCKDFWGILKKCVT